jgi:uncharacterized protein (DUF58 family)
VNHTLLDPAFARELEAMRRLLQARSRSHRTGDRRGKRRGGAAEFLEHRSYEHGDDIRRIDWLAYARTGAPKVKLFHEDEDVILRLAIDTSASMALGEPSKLHAAVRLAAAVGYLALSTSERAEVIALGAPADGAPSPAGRARRRGPHRGRSSVPALLGELAALAPGGAVDLDRALADAVAHARRPGLLLVASDFFDPGPLALRLERAAAAGHDLMLVHVLGREEVAPTLEGDFTLVDAESGEELTVTADAAALAAYGAELAELGRRLHAVAHRRRGTYLRAVSDEPLLPVVRRLVERVSDAPVPVSPA